jgi:murein DD-endopeptidase MepM/ murein hydrolase activator NlpD
MEKKIIRVITIIMAAVMILSLLLSLFASGMHVHAASSSEIKDQIDQLKDEQAEVKDKIAQLEAQRKKNQADIKSLVAEKNNFDQQVGLLYNQIQSTGDLISAYNLLIADKQKELDAAQQKLTDLNEAYRERLRAMEEEGELSYWSVLFQASSFADFLDRLNMIQEIAGADRRRLEQLDAAAKAVEETKALLTQEKAGLEETKLGLEQAQKELERKSAEASTLLNELIAKGEEYIKYVEECEEQDRIMMEQIADKQAQYDKAKYSEWLATSVPPTTRPASRPNTVDGITWLVPTQNYRITSPYGMRIHPVYGYPKMHTGVDLAAPLNTPIYATRAGVVVWAGWGSTGGWWVKVDHGDGFASTYLHLTRYVVKIGDFVEAGQIVGYMGSTGVSTGSHLHFGIMFNGEWVNPLKYVKA